MKFCCALMIALLNYVSAIKPLEPDIDISNITDIVTKNGYPIQMYEIETEDGYLLGTYRIPYGRRSKTKEDNKYPVIVMHGLLTNSESFLITGPGKALGYTLADTGYDVWLCNARGNNHSRKHRSLNAETDKRFWQFSWHEIGAYDIPAVIDYVLKVTHKKKLHYVGHSQGATTFFVMGSERPEYNKKMSVAITLSPVVFTNHMRPSIFKLLAPFYPIIEETIPLIISTQPGGASLRQLYHFSQVIISGAFQKYDWGKKENLKKYGSEIPPEYNLKNIIAPVALFYAKNDLVAEKDVLHLAEVLPNVVELYKVPYENWTHVDFIWAKDIDDLLHKEVIQVMRHFNDQ